MSTSEPKQVDFGIIIAKDHEKEGFLDGLKSWNIKIVEHKGLEIYYATFVIYSEDKKPFTCGFSYMNDQGKEISKFTKAFIRVANPRYLTTLGICGSKDDWQNQAIFFKEAKVVDETGTTETIKAMYSQYGNVEAWRRHQDFVVKPADAWKILTLHTIEDQVSQTLSSHTDCHAIDMEIGAIFSTTLKVNDKRKRTNEPPVVTLMAVKGVSDSGNKQIRDANKRKALRNATKAFMEYLFYLIDHLFDSTTNNLQGSATEVAANTNNNST